MSNNLLIVCFWFFGQDSKFLFSTVGFIIKRFTYFFDFKNNNRCRRKLIASHFDESWDSTDCNKMCDNCSNSTTVKRICINKYCMDLYKILDAALENDTKVTGMLFK